MTGSSFDHLLALSDDVGIFEHAEHATPRLEHGYCVDDVARLLVVIAREPESSREVQDLARTALLFLLEAQDADGRIRNRRSADGEWHGPHVVEDCWGRSLWAFGTAVRRSADDGIREGARSGFDRGVGLRSPWPRAMAFAALGAAEILEALPDHREARTLLEDAIAVIGRASPDAEWPWPERRITYANAALPEALLVAGRHLERPDLIDEGLTLLTWLLDRETVDGHLSPTPVGGADRDHTPPAFDQQPIEIAAMADACAQAWTVTGNVDWLRGVDLAVQWFDGLNDAGVAMWDRETGAGFDGLHETGRNDNRGAESTLAVCSTRQHLSLLAVQA